MNQDIKDISEKELTKLYAEYQAGWAVPCRLSFIATAVAFRVACRLRILRLGNPVRSVRSPRPGCRCHIIVGSLAVDSFTARPARIGMSAQ
jgi:hypothetical protein